MRKSHRGRLKRTLMSGIAPVSQLEDAYLSSINSLAKTLEFKDEYTHGHAERVAEMCLKIGKRMKMDEKSLKVLYNAALLHDIGKIGVMESILKE